MLSAYKSIVRKFQAYSPSSNIPKNNNFRNIFLFSSTDYYSVGSYYLFIYTSFGVTTTDVILAKSLYSDLSGYYHV